MGAFKDNLALALYFAFWYVGNYYYNIQNKLALNASGGKHGGLGMTVATMQLGVGAVYALLVWVVSYNLIPLCGFKAPAKQPPPKINTQDLFKMVPVAFCSAAAHSSSVLALNAGSVSFGQIVKAAEPAFSALVNTVVYGKSPSLAKWMVLPFIIAGVAFACLKPSASGGYVIEFDTTALTMASIANLFAAFKGSENHKLMDTPGLKDRIGPVGNQFALTTINGFLLSIPLMVYLEGDSFGKFVELMKTSEALRYNLIASGMTFYLYNELATMTIKQTGAVTASVANTAKRVIVIVGVAIAMNKPLTFEEQVGSAIAITAVFVYSVVDKIFAPSKKSKKV